MKNTRSMWMVSEAMNRSAAQWWICRISSPPRTSKLMFSVDSYASLIRMPLSLVYEPWYTTSFMDGTKNSERKVPVSSRTTKDHSAISPSMNDQWSGNTFRMSTRKPRAPWNLSSSHPPVPRQGLRNVEVVSLIRAPRSSGRPAG